MKKMEKNQVKITISKCKNWNEKYQWQKILSHIVTADKDFVSWQNSLNAKKWNKINNQKNKAEKWRGGVNGELLSGWLVRLSA